MTFVASCSFSSRSLLLCFVATALLVVQIWEFFTHLSAIYAKMLLSSLLLRFFRCSCWLIFSIPVQVTNESKAYILFGVFRHLFKRIMKRCQGELNWNFTVNRVLKRLGIIAEKKRMKFKSLKQVCLAEWFEFTLNFFWQAQNCNQ